MKKHSGSGSGDSEPPLHSFMSRLKKTAAQGGKIFQKVFSFCQSSLKNESSFSMGMDY